MHQLPRPSPVTASPANSPQTNPARTNNPRDRDRDPEMALPQTEVGEYHTRGLGIEQETELNEQEQTSSSGKDAVTKLNQIVQNYHTKAALIIAHSRVDLPPSYLRGSDAKRVNRWFNVELDETDVLRGDLQIWKNCDTTDNRPPPLIIETFLDPDELTSSQSLVIIDDHGKRWDVLEALAASTSQAGRRSHKAKDNRVILERWRIELGDAPIDQPTDLNSILPKVYKKSIVIFRSLQAYSRFLPAWKFSKRQSKMKSSPALKIRYQIKEGSPGSQHPRVDNLTAPLYDSTDPTTESYSFGTIESPAGPFSVRVTYRTNCEFRVDDSEALLSSRFMGADDTFFRPSLPSDDTIRASGQEVGSLPVDTRDAEQPDHSQAYGSMSTFHHVGPRGASPISALRAARDMGNMSPQSPVYPSSPKGQAARVRSGDGAFHAQRRPSVSFPLFKAPPLSASPALLDTPFSTSPRTLPSRPGPTPSTSNRRSMPPPSTAASATRKASQASENAIASSASASPKPAPISKFSSSFSNRRGRLSSGAASKADDGNNSSGQASASSSTAQPSSGLLAEASGSMQADEDNISQFLKILDMGKDLLTPANSAELDASNRRTSAALSRFQRMRDSNAVLSDSMYSSLHLNRSSISSSRQLTSVPAMIQGASISTSSSPGKPISPHTPAIPSRLSANSIVDYTEHTENRRHRLSHEEHDSGLEGNTSDETAAPPTTSNASAIDIPTSPRPFISSYRRSSSAAQRRSSAVVDDDMGESFPFGMRSISLGAEDRSPLSLSALLRQQEPDNRGMTTNTQAGQPQPRPHTSQPSEETGPERPSSTSSTTPYQPRFAHHRGRGSISHTRSHSSTSSSFGRGNPIPTSAPDRDREPYNNGSGSNSGVSTAPDTRRPGAGSGAGVQRFGSTARNHPSSQANFFDEDEPLLFTMSDFSVSRRSLEEARRGSVGPGEAPGGGLRRGSSRRGTGSAGGFHG
ncbi:hypothetical protein AJ80_08840 [Polytolypa hystricis UAMH7299]|uniref:Autophagy-related protein 13 n=1 Tax=Polytolypa hystricis (strain UAMH7299) TaxID=1447883 RepID=A0A2B7X0W1_POLH7|nr:hypothetical protein AJ80_08840 [Polytolypa hystricis UAMH7299]